MNKWENREGKLYHIKTEVIVLAEDDMGDKVFIVSAKIIELNEDIEFSIYPE